MEHINMKSCLEFQLYFQYICSFRNMAIFMINSKVMVAHALDIERETYLAVLMDRAFNGPVLVGSPDGGMDIEEVAEKTPERIFTMPIDINDGISRDQAVEMAKNLNFEGWILNTENSNGTYTVDL